MSKDILHTHPSTDPELPLSEVILHVAKPVGYRHLQWVGGISVNEEAWQHEYAAGQIVDRVTARLPVYMATGLLHFAARYLLVKNLGPNAIDPRTAYSCHTLAKAIGYTALKTVPDLPRGLENTTEARMFRTGTKIEPAELAVGEWAVVGHPLRSRTGRGTGVSHSMVGIGHVDGERTRYRQSMAIQVDQGQGSLYIGDPEQYIQYEVERWQSTGGGVAPPGLYVKR